VADVLADDLAELGDDDESAEQLAAGSATAAAGSGAALGRKERGLSEVRRAALVGQGCWRMQEAAAGRPRAADFSQAIFLLQLTKARLNT
jgi:hypothetical protein